MDMQVMLTPSYALRPVESQVLPSNKYTRCLYKWRRGVQFNFKRSPKSSQAFKTIQTFANLPIQKPEPEVLRSLGLEVPNPASTVPSLPVNNRLHTQVVCRHQIRRTTSSRSTP